MQSTLPKSELRNWKEKWGSGGARNGRKNKIYHSYSIYTLVVYDHCQIFADRNSCMGKPLPRIAILPIFAQSFVQTCISLRFHQQAIQHERELDWVRALYYGRASIDEHRTDDALFGTKTARVLMAFSRLISPDIPELGQRRVAKKWFTMLSCWPHLMVVHNWRPGIFSHRFLEHI